MGGSDPFALTYFVAKALIDTGFNITFLLSSLCTSFLKVKRLIESSGRHNMHIKERTDNMALEMDKADLIILNGGLTRYEACLSGKPFIAISIHEKQFKITQKLTNLGVGINLGVYKDMNEDKLALQVSNLMADYTRRATMSACMRNLNLKNGARFIFDSIISSKNI